MVLSICAILPDDPAADMPGLSPALSDLPARASRPARGGDNGGMPEPRISFAGYRRALRFIVPYWPRLVLVLLTGIAATGLGLLQPYISKLLIDDALAK